MSKDIRKAKTYGLMVYEDGTPALDLLNMTFISERDTIEVHSSLKGVTIGININTLAEFINKNRPDLFEPF